MTWSHNRVSNVFLKSIQPGESIEAILDLVFHCIVYSLYCHRKATAVSASECPESVTLSGLHRPALGLHAVTEGSSAIIVRNCRLRLLVVAVWSVAGLSGGLVGRWWWVEWSAGYHHTRTRHRTTLCYQSGMDALAATQPDGEARLAQHTRTRARGPSGPQPPALSSPVLATRQETTLLQTEEGGKQQH